MLRGRPITTRDKYTGQKAKVPEAHSPRYC
jgi:hypothetical protein